MNLAEKLYKRHQEVRIAKRKKEYETIISKLNTVAEDGFCELITEIHCLGNISKLKEEGFYIEERFVVRQDEYLISFDINKIKQEDKEK